MVVVQTVFVIVATLMELHLSLVYFAVKQIVFVHSRIVELNVRCLQSFQSYSFLFAIAKNSE